LTPEDLARQNIDQQLIDCGWIFQDLADMNIMAGHGVAVREIQLTTRETDYGLYIDGRVAGVIEAKKRAGTLVTSFRQFIEDNKDEIEAISILYSRPYTAGLRYNQIKDLARRRSIKPFRDALGSPVDESQPQTLLKLWQAFGAVHPDKVNTNGKHCKHIAGDTHQFPSFALGC
jgi:hypothetical protein